MPQTSRLAEVLNVPSRLIGARSEFQLRLPSTTRIVRLSRLLSRIYLSRRRRRRMRTIVCDVIDAPTLKTDRAFAHF